MLNKRNVLFVCIENSCRSQMAEALTRMQADEFIEAWSAGSQPSGRIHPLAVASMAELGYDLTTHHSKSLDVLPKISFDYVITMGCGDTCPFIPAKYHEDWEIPDPSNFPLDEYRVVRGLIGEHVKELISKLRNSSE